MTPDLFWLTSARGRSFGTLKIEYACFPLLKSLPPRQFLRYRESGTAMNIFMIYQI